MDENMALCAKINFENLERMLPGIDLHPIYRIAKAQLDEAVGECKIEDSKYMKIGKENG